MTIPRKVMVFGTAIDIFVLTSTFQENYHTFTFLGHVEKSVNEMAFINMSTELLRKKIHEIKIERRIANEKHEQETFIYKKRQSEMNKTLFRAIRYVKVYNYIQSLHFRSDNASPFVIHRQAILCAILHKEEVVTRQILLSKLHQEQVVSALDSFQTLITNEFSETIKSLSLSILMLKHEINLLESSIQTNFDDFKPIEAPPISDGEVGYLSEFFSKFNMSKRSIATWMQDNTSSCPSTPSKLISPLLHDSERVGLIAKVA